MIFFSNLLLLFLSPFVLYQDQVSARPNSTRVCVVGKVVKPLDLSFNDGLTLTEAIDKAGGIVPGSKNIRVLVISSGPGDKGQIIDVDLKAIVKNQKPDLKLQAFDVVEVLSRKREKEQKPFVNPCPWRPIVGLF